MITRGFRVTVEPRPMSCSTESVLAGAQACRNGVLVSGDWFRSLRTLNSWRGRLSIAAQRSRSVGDGPAPTRLGGWARPLAMLVARTAPAVPALNAWLTAPPHA